MYVKPMHDLVRRALSEGDFDHGGQTKPELECSFLHTVAVGSVLAHHGFNPISTIQAYQLLVGVVEDTNALDLQKICKIHTELLANSSWVGGMYMEPGETRTSTGKMVVIGGPPRAQCCPYKKAGEELSVILDLAKVASGLVDLMFPHSPDWSAQRYMEEQRNPFAVASWLHYVLTNCHPFSVSFPTQSGAPYSYRQGSRTETDAYPA